MILSNAKPSNEKICKQLVKIWKKRKKFSKLSINYMKLKKTHCFTGLKILKNSQNTTVFTQQA